jgi:hypothetical protein
MKYFIWNQGGGSPYHAPINPLLKSDLIFGGYIYASNEKK